MISNVKFSPFCLNLNKNNTKNVGFGNSDDSSKATEAAMKAAEQVKIASSEFNSGIPDAPGQDSQQILRQAGQDFFEKNTERQKASGQEIV